MKNKKTLFWIILAVVFLISFWGIILFPMSFEAKISDKVNLEIAYMKSNQKEASETYSLKPKSSQFKQIHNLIEEYRYHRIQRKAGTIPQETDPSADHLILVSGKHKISISTSGMVEIDGEMFSMIYRNQHVSKELIQKILKICRK